MSEPLMTKQLMSEPVISEPLIPSSQTRAASSGRLLSWVDSSRLAQVDADNRSQDRIDWLRVTPFILMHLACLLVFVVGFSPLALMVALGLYLVRMFAITAFYHRYLSHRAFRTGRIIQFLFAVVAASAVQRGPLWWAGHHRLHHRHSDEKDDAHSPAQHGLLWSHMGWFLSRRHFATPKAAVRDLARFAELRFLDRFDVVVPALLGVSLYASGEWLHASYPALGTSGMQLLVWGFFISTVVLFHATFTINSLAHRVGTRRFDTADSSRNNALLALLTLGEGWHNNHHYYPHSVRQGFRWWEFDPTWWLLRGMAALGLVHDLKPVPADLMQDERP